MTAAIAEIRRIDPAASAAVKPFKLSKVVEEDTATRVGNAKSDGAASKSQVNPVALHTYAHGGRIIVV